MNVKEVTIKELVDIADKNWGYRKKKIEDSHIATVLDILIGDGHPFVGTGNTEHLPCIIVWKPFINLGDTKNKIIGYYTLTKKEWDGLIDSNYVEESRKAEKTLDIKKCLKIARKLYDD